MYLRDREQDTICAVSTPNGVGGISVIRISGKNAFAYIKKLANFLPEALESHKIYFGNLSNFNKTKIIDEVLISTFINPKSFTGEDVAEISCHGNPVISSWIIEELIKTGCRVADKGEFTLRAFLNNKLDLVQAESVLEVIESQSKLSAEISLKQLKGGLSQKIVLWEDEVLWCLAHIEAGIDFSTEDIDVVDKTTIKAKLENILAEINNLLKTYDSGKVINQGIDIVLFGRPNVGKSSLLNSLIGEEKAIVTNVPGTTRDLIEHSLFVNGVLVRLVDTAGLHETDDLVESIGIRKTREAILKSNIQVFVFDVAQGLNNEDLKILHSLDLSKCIIVGNKVDQVSPQNRAKLKLNIKQSLMNSKYFTELDNQYFDFENFFLLISTLDVKDVQQVIDAVSKWLEKYKIEDETSLFQSRHFEGLAFSAESISNAKKMIEDGVGFELISVELKSTLIKLQELVGKRFDDQILDKIFKEFCLGK